MVKEITKYQCPYCSEMYDDEYEANDCAEECAKALVEPDEPIAKESYQCECCEKIYNRSHMAVACERKHHEKKDRFYDAYLNKLERDKLMKAAQAKGQLKLNEVK